MKRLFKTLIILILLSIIGLELFYYLKNNSNFIKFINKRYLVDITTPYYANPLSYDIHHLNNNSKIYYISIKGLKNKKIEDKINKEIEKKITKLSKEVDLDKYTLYTTNYLGFENTLSIEFIKTEEIITNYDEQATYYDGEVLDTLNVSLKTGNNLTLLDVINDSSKLKEQLYKDVEKSISFSIGDAYNTCYDCDIIPDYREVEDSTLSVINAFNKNNYLFSYRDSTLNFYFHNVYVYNPVMITEYEDDLYKECQNNSSCTFIKGQEEKYYLKNDYDQDFRISLSYLDMTDNLIIYDKFKGNNLFTKDRIKIERKFNEFDDYAYLSECEYGNCQYFKEIDNTIYDITVNTYDDNAKEYTDDLVNNLKKKRKENSIYKVSCDTYYLYPKDYYYFACSNYNYELTKKDYQKYRSLVYLNSYTRFNTSLGAYSIKDFYGYDFIDDKLSTNIFSYKLIDNNQEVKLQDILTDTIYDYIPYDYLKYDSKENLVKNMELYMDNNDYKKDTLGLHINMFESKIYMQYNDDIYMLAESKNDSDYDEFYNNSEIIINDLFK